MAMARHGVFLVVLDSDGFPLAKEEWRLGVVDDAEEAGRRYDVFARRKGGRDRPYIRTNRTPKGVALSGVKDGRADWKKGSEQW